MKGKMSCRILKTRIRPFTPSLMLRSHILLKVKLRCIQNSEQRMKKHIEIFNKTLSGLWKMHCKMARLEQRSSFMKIYGNGKRQCMKVAMWGVARWMEEVKPIQKYFRDGHEDNISLSLHGDKEIPGPRGLIWLTLTFNISMCCPLSGQDCIHMFIPGCPQLEKTC